MTASTSCSVTIRSPEILSAAGIAASLRRPQFRDVVLRPADAGGDELRCHRPVLAAASPLLSRLMGDLGEEDELLLVLPDHTSEQVARLMDVVYLNRDVTAVGTGVKDLLDCLGIEIAGLKKTEGKAEKTDEEGGDRKEVDDKDGGSVHNSVEVRLKAEAPDGPAEEPTTCGYLVKGEVEERHQKSSSRRRRRLAAATAGLGRYVDTENEDPSLGGVVRVKRRGKYLVKKAGACPYCPDQVASLLDHVFDGHRDKYEEFAAGFDSGGRKCSHCDKWVRCLAERLEHSKEHRRPIGRPRNYVCEACGLVADGRQRHKHCKKRYLACEVEACKEVLTNYLHLRDHLLFVHKIGKPTHQKGKGNCLCPQCGFKLVSKVSLKHHLEVVHGAAAATATYECPECRKVIKTQRSYRRHLQLHQANEFKCPFCDKRFTDRGYVARHIRTAHTRDSDKRFRCRLCGKGFNNPVTLDGHMNMHNKERPYVCRWCAKAYQNDANRLAHERKSHKELYSRRGEQQQAHSAGL